MADWSNFPWEFGATFGTAQARCPHCDVPLNQFDMRNHRDGCPYPDNYYRNMQGAQMSEAAQRGLQNAIRKEDDDDVGKS